MSGRVLVVGSYNQDHAWRVARFPAPGETVRGEGFATGAGGKGFNQAVAAARQGADTVFIGARGDDALGRMAEHNAREAGIECHWQVLADQPTGSAAILVDADGQNQIIVTLGANEKLAADFVTGQGAPFASARVLLMQLESPIAAVRAAVAAAASHEALRILNPAPFDATLDESLLRQCELLTPNETEFALLLQQFAGVSIAAGHVADMGDSELHALCRKLPVASIIVTLGKRGCFVSHAETSGTLHDTEACYRIQAEKVRTIDSTGAGDAFNGALAAALLRWPRAPLRQCVVHAGRAAALSTEGAGAAASMVTFEDVVERFGDNHEDQNGSRVPPSAAPG